MVLLTMEPEEHMRTPIITLLEVVHRLTASSSALAFSLNFLPHVLSSNGHKAIEFHKVQIVDAGKASGRTLCCWLLLTG